MTPNFALTLSHQGVALLQRTPRGWLLVGEVALDDPALDARLAVLRTTAMSMAPEGLATKLVIPQSEVLYTELPSPGPDPLLREEAIRASLEGVTPYPVDKLAFDWAASGDRLRLAVVARQTLEEAEAFADAHGFAPVSFVARPDDGQFLGEPFFGTAARLGPDAQVDRDVVPVDIAGEAERPAVEVTPIFARAAWVSGVALQPAVTRPAVQDKPVATSDPERAPSPALQPADVGGTAPESDTKAADVPPTDAGPMEAGSEDRPAREVPPQSAAERALPEDFEPAKADGSAAGAPTPAASVEAASSASLTTGADKAPSAPPKRVLPRLPGAAADPAQTDRVGAPPKLAGAARKDRPSGDTGAEETAADDPGRDGLTATPQAAAAPSINAASEVSPPAPAQKTPAAQASRAAAGAAVTLASLKERSSQPLAVDGSATEAEAMTVFGARRTPPAAPSHRTGLMLTAALAIALAGVGIWAAFFMPGPEGTAELAPEAGGTATIAPLPDTAVQGTSPTEESSAASTEQAAAPQDPAVTAAEEGGPGAAPTPGETAIAEPDPASLASSIDTPRPDGGESLALGALGAGDLHRVRLEAPPTADAPDTPTGPRLPNIGALPPDPESALDATGDTQAPDGATTGTLPPAERDLAIEVTQGAPDLIPDLRRTMQSRHLVLEGGIAVPAEAEPLPRPPGLGGDGMLLAPSPLSGSGLDSDEPVATAADRAASQPPEPDLRDSAALEPAVAEDSAGSAELTGAEPVSVQTAGSDTSPGASLWAAPSGAAAGRPAEEDQEQSADAAVSSVGSPDQDRAAAVGASLVTGRSATAPAADPVTVMTALGPKPRVRPASLSGPPGPTHLVVQNPAAADPRAPLRPGSIVDLAAAAEARLASATARAVATSPVPGLRPSDFGAVVARARSTTTPAAPVSVAPTATAAVAPAPAAAAPQPAAPAPQPVATPPAPTPQAPSLPTRASVAQQATENRAINLRQVNLIGVFGTSSQRRALVRLSNGQIAAVRVGDRLDGGQVAAIGENELRYVRNGRNTVLRIGG